MFKKTKARANIRRKASSSDEESKSSPTKSQTSVKTEPIPTSNPVISLVSFDHQEEGDVEFRVKKSKNQSRKLDKIRRQMEIEANQMKHKNENESDDEVRVIKNEQSDDEITEIRSATESMSTTKIEHDEDEQKSKSPQMEILAGDQLDDSDGDLPNQDRFTKLTSRQGDKSSPFNREGDASSIPSSDMVYRARKQREQARRGGFGGGEVITMSKPLDDTQKYAKTKSRLIRDDDDNDMDDDEMGAQGTRGFYSRVESSKKDHADRLGQQDRFLAYEHGDSPTHQSGHDSDEGEFARWEREQIRKGVTAQQMNTLDEHAVKVQERQARKENRPFDTKFANDNDMDLDTDEIVKPPRQRAQINQKIAEIMSMQNKNTLNVEQLLAKMKARTEDAAHTITGHRQDMSRIDGHIEEGEERLKEIEKLTPLVQHKFLLYQEMVAFSRDLIDCFCEKMPQIEQLEERWLAQLQSKSDFIQRRRRLDVQDQFEQCKLQVKGGNLNIATDTDRVLRTSERESRRTRRRQAREKAQNRSHNDGMSSDDELVPSRIAVGEKEYNDIMTELSTIFDDVNEEFSSITQILNKFVRWIAVDPTSFEDAYIALCLPKLLSPLIRAQLIGQSPLDVNCTIPQSTTWFRDICRMGMDADTGVMYVEKEINEHEGVVMTAPLVVEKIVLGRWTEIISRSFDPLSTRQCNQLSQSITNLLNLMPHVEPGCKQLHKMLQAIVSRIRTSLDEDLFMPMYPKEVLANPATGARAFHERQFWTAMKAIHNIALFSECFSPSTLCTLIMDGIVNRHIVFGLQCASSDWTDEGTMNKCRVLTDALGTIVFALSPPQPPTNLTKDTARPSQIAAYTQSQIDPLAKFMCRIGEQAATSGKAKVLKQIHEMLMKIRAEEHAGRLKTKAKNKKSSADFF